jgi:predicted SAM-dependent methyltransferase
MSGYINVDKFGDPYLRFDLETFPYPWDDNSVAEIELHHVLEHLGQQTDTYLKIIQELDRICQPGAKIHISDCKFTNKPVRVGGLCNISHDFNRRHF